MIDNPIYQKVYENVDINKNCEKKVIEKYSLYLSFLMSLSFVLGILIPYEMISSTIWLIIIISSLILSITSLVLIPHIERPQAFIIVFPIFSGIFLSSISLYLKNTFKMMYETYNPYSFGFMTIGITIMSLIMLSEIFYFLDIFKVRHFYFKYILLSLFDLFISLFVIFFISNNIETYSFIFNSLVSTITIFIFNFIIVLYHEEERKIVELGIDKNDAFILSILPLTVVYYISQEIVFLMFKKH